MELEFKKEGSDSRGKFVLCYYGRKKISVFEIRKGLSRGGFTWEKEIQQTVIFGKVEYKTQNIETGKEKILTIQAPKSVNLPPKTADLITAIEDSILTEIGDIQNESKVFPKYRKIIEETTV